MAATWTIFVAWLAGVRISVADPIAMFLAVWMLYAADRLLDARPMFHIPSQPGLEERHRYHHAHRNRFLAVILAASLPLAWLLYSLSAAVLQLYMLLVCLLSAWLLLVHARPASASSSAHRLPKELAVGVFFPAAVFIPTVARAPALRHALLPAAIAFACVCTLNCLFLFAWEHPYERNHAHFSTRLGARHLKHLTLLLIALTCAAAFRGIPRAHLPIHQRTALLACSLSGVLLWLLHGYRLRIPRTTLRALADLALLTPVPISLSLWLMRHCG